MFVAVKIFLGFNCFSVLYLLGRTSKGNAVERLCMKLYDSVRDLSVLATGLGFIVAIATIKGGLRPPLLDF
jgi:hypothetical protein